MSLSASACDAAAHAAGGDPKARRRLRLPVRRRRMSDRRVKRTGGLPLVATGFALVVFSWVLDVLVNVYVFRQGDLRSQLFHPIAEELWSRALASGLILA